MRGRCTLLWGSRGRTGLSATALGPCGSGAKGRAWACHPACLCGTPGTATPAAGLEPQGVWGVVETDLEA